MCGDGVGIEDYFPINEQDDQSCLSPEQERFQKCDLAVLRFEMGRMNESQIQILTVTWSRLD